VLAMEGISYKLVFWQNVLLKFKWSSRGGFTNFLALGEPKPL